MQITVSICVILVLELVSSFDKKHLMPSPFSILRSVFAVPYLLPFLYSCIYTMYPASPHIVTTFQPKLFNSISSLPRVFHFSSIRCVYILFFSSHLHYSSLILPPQHTLPSLAYLSACSLSPCLPTLPSVLPTWLSVTPTGEPRWCLCESLRPPDSLTPSPPL